ncbi:GNAT family protein [Teredinibacter turnerae]|uniref:GNAT family N-acetyltransferase n=1 Tax=Teredinibacter turnerae TaxID=2426 RepID=UPI0030D23B02
MDYIISDDVYIQQLSFEHTQALFRLTEANRDYLREWLPWLDTIRSSEDTRSYIRSTITESSAGGAPNFAVFYKSRLCGVAGFHPVDRHNRTSAIGYWLAEKYTGQGIMTSVVKTLLDIGFQQYDLNKLEIHCAENNARSRAIAERLGFTYEATLRECEWLYSKYVNHAIYSMLASEYSSQ